MALSLVFMSVSFKDAQYGIGVNQWNVPLHVYSPYFLFVSVWNLQAFIHIDN
jgi:hypothetical protein